jgi:plasmid stabilization system protein ParE
MIVIVSDAAEQDLETIGDGIESGDPVRARGFLKELRLACQTLRDAPLEHALVPRYEHDRIRRRVHGNYLIFYRLLGGVIEVLHVLHGAADAEAILFPDG